MKKKNLRKHTPIPRLADSIRWFNHNRHDTRGFCFVCNKLVGPKQDERLKVRETGKV